MVWYSHLFQNFPQFIVIQFIVLLFCDTMDCNLLATSIHGIFQQEYWSGLPFHSPEDLSHPGIEPMSHALQADFY